jgi:RNA polymerase sigma-70 factor (ECF subfamily)
MPLSGRHRWRVIPARSNGQVAFGKYLWHEEERAFLPHGVNVLTMRGSQIAEVTAFIDADTFAGFGLPAELPAIDERRP